MSLTAAAAVGGAIGITHALEADHLAAMATLVDEKRAGHIGASWGIGHTAPIALLGLCFVVLGIQLPSQLTAAFEVVVGAVLVYYGARLAADATGIAVRKTHRHDGPAHDHLRVGGVSLGLTHGHLDGESAFVGVLHGLAGSGGLVVAMATTTASVDAAVVFLLAFGLLTTATMTLVAAVWGRTLGTGLTRVLKGIGGVLGTAIGAALVTEVLLGIALLP
ncbi:MAG: hypothetical protein V5A45_10155 [Haloarculaceae archaeon]